MLYLVFIIEKRLYLAGIPNHVKSDFAIGKSLQFINKTLAKFLISGWKSNLITTNFVSSNNHFGIYLFFFLFVESEKSAFDELNRITSIFVLILLSSLSKSIGIFLAFRL